MCAVRRAVQRPQLSVEAKGRQASERPNAGTAQRGLRDLDSGPYMSCLKMPGAANPERHLVDS
jgi:hypothetical protein